jgi:glycosyltransferase involved in cell wall biosynthesis
MNVAARRRAHLVNWLQDIYPEVATQLGVPFIKGPIFRGIVYFRDRSLTKATVSVVVGELMAEKVASRGVAKDRIRVITNWSEDETIVPVSADLNPLRQQWHLGGKFVVGYSGNLGRAHEFNTILAAAARLCNRNDIVFVCVGGGHLLGQLAQLVQRRGLTNFRFLAYQERAILRDSLSVPDVHWLSLRPELEGLIVPSKVYGIAAAGRPIIAMCAENGEIARMIGQYQCGIVIRPGDSDALVASLQTLYEDAALRAQMGRNSRAMLEGHFTRRQSLSRWRDVITHTASCF